MGNGWRKEKIIVSHCRYWRYFMGVQIVSLCQGPVDAIRRIIVGEREAWSGLVTDNSTIYINKPELFGGDDREGGVIGNVDVLDGCV